MCREKNHPRGPHRCKGVPNESRRARRAANNLYRDSLAAAVEARGNPDLAARVRGASMSAMPMLTEAAGMHPTEVAGALGRVPGLAGTHRPSDADEELAAQMRAELDDGDYDGLYAARDAARDTYAAGAGDLPDDPHADSAMTRRWAPEELDEVGNEEAARAILEDMGGIDPDADDYRARLDSAVARFDAHAKASGSGGWFDSGPLGMYTRHQLHEKAGAYDGPPPNVYADAAESAERAQGAYLAHVDGIPSSLDDKGIPAPVADDEDFRAAVDAATADETLGAYIDYVQAETISGAQAERFSTDFTPGAAGDVERQRHERLTERQRVLSGELYANLAEAPTHLRKTAAARLWDAAAEAEGSFEPGAGAAANILRQRAADIRALPVGDNPYAGTVARIQGDPAAGTGDPADIPDYLGPDEDFVDRSELVERFRDDLNDEFSASISPDPDQTVARHVAATEKAARALEAEGRTGQAAAVRSAAYAIPYIVDVASDEASQTP